MADGRTGANDRTGAGEARPGDWFRQWEQSVAKWWEGALNDPAFVKGMGDQLASGAAARTMYEEGVDEAMSRMHLPSKADVVRMARIASLLEDRLVAMEDRLAEASERIVQIEKEALKARVDAASALVEIQDALRRIEGRLSDRDSR